MKLNAPRVGLVCGLLWGGFLAILTVAAVLYPPYGDAFVKVVASVYPGYSATWAGVGLGLLYGFVDWFFGGLIFAWLYNLIGQKK